MRSICVFCGSATGADPLYEATARTLGRRMAETDFGLVYGGGDIGLMGILARAVHEADGHVCGVIPNLLKAREGVAYEVADELITTQSMSERKTVMFSRCDAFLVMAGGIGTLDEWLEALTLKQLGFHQKPIVVLNTAGIFDGMLESLLHLEKQGFLSPRSRTLYHVCQTVDEALDFLDPIT